MKTSAEGKIQYQFSAELWKYSSPAGWYFVSLPGEISAEIRAHLKWQEEGWGRMKASARIGELEWETAIWFDRKRQSYLLPIKAEIRKKAGLQLNQSYELSIRI